MSGRQQPGWLMSAYIARMYKRNAKQPGCKEPPQELSTLQLTSTCASFALRPSTQVWMEAEVAASTCTTSNRPDPACWASSCTLGWRQSRRGRRGRTAPPALDPILPAAQPAAGKRKQSRLSARLPHPPPHQYARPAVVPFVLGHGTRAGQMLPRPSKPARSEQTNTMLALALVVP